MGLPPDHILATFHCIVLFSFRGQISIAGRFLLDELGFVGMWQRTSQSAFPQHWMLTALFLPAFHTSECWAPCNLCSSLLWGVVKDKGNGDAV